MSGPNKSSLRNRLLSLVSDEDFDQMRFDLAPIDLPKGLVLVEPDQPFDYVYFPESGIGSVIAVSPEGQQAEAGLYGRDGMAPVAVVLGADLSVHRHLVQVEGVGHRLAVSKVVEAMNRSSGLRNLMMRYAQVCATQTSYTTLSNAVHPIDERLARWILMCHDRVDGNQIALTHEFLSVMLAVRRPSVTTALHVLEGNGFIRTTRAAITVRDREGLEEFAGDGYGRPEAEYRRLIG